MGSPEKVLQDRNLGRDLVYEQRFATQKEREGLEAERIIMRQMAVCEGLLRNWRKVEGPLLETGS